MMHEFFEESEEQDDIDDQKEMSHDAWLAGAIARKAEEQGLIKPSDDLSWEWHQEFDAEWQQALAELTPESHFGEGEPLGEGEAGAEGSGAPIGEGSPTSVANSAGDSGPSQGPDFGTEFGGDFGGSGGFSGDFGGNFGGGHGGNF